MGLEEKPFASTGKRRKYGFWVWKRRVMVVWKRKVLGLEEKTFASTGKRRKKEEEKKKKIF